MEGRNRCTFENVECTRTQLLAIFNSSLYEWSYASGLTDSDPVESFKESLYMKIILFFVSLGSFMSFEHEVVSIQ